MPLTDGVPSIACPPALNRDNVGYEHETAVAGGFVHRLFHTVCVTLTFVFRATLQLRLRKVHAKVEMDRCVYTTLRGYFTTQLVTSLGPSTICR